MTHAPQPLPKAGSGPFRELWEETKRALDLPRTVLVLEGAVDRKSLEEILQRLMKGAAARPGQMPRAELVGRLADAFHRNADAAYALMKELDKSCHKERHIVASIDEASLDERLSTYRALDFRRERARLVWALLRDGREAPKKAAEKILVDAFAQIQKAEEAHVAAGATPGVTPGVTSGATPGAAPEAATALEQRLTSYERAIEQQQKELQRAVGLKESVERERSELMARLGQRERALRDEEQIRRRIEDENRRLQEELAVLRGRLEQSQPERLTAALEEAARWKEKARALEQRAERVGRVDEMEAELERLAREHDGERRRWERVREELDEQLRVIATREKAALDRLHALREELKVARRQLAGEAAEPPAQPAAARVGVFVDAANLSASARREFGSKLDYRSLLAHVVDGRPKASAVAFVVRDGEEGAYLGFVSSLRDSGYEIREKRPKPRSDGTRKADWDMGIAMEILDQLDSLDVVVLCSGDGDFVPLVQRLRREGKRVEVAAFRASTDEALVKAADVFVPLDGRFRMAS